MQQVTLERAQVPASCACTTTPPLGAGARQAKRQRRRTKSARSTSIEARSTDTQKFAQENTSNCLNARARACLSLLVSKNRNCGFAKPRSEARARARAPRNTHISVDTLNLSGLKSASCPACNCAFDGVRKICFQRHPRLPHLAHRLAGRTEKQSGSVILPLW